MLYEQIRSPRHLGSQHVSALNLKINRDVPLDQLFPAQYLPPSKWEKAPSLDYNKGNTSTSVSVTGKLSNGVLFPGHQAYHSRMKELLCDNGDAYHALTRQPLRPGRSAVRPEHFRKFYVVLQIVGEFWDTSLDGPAPDHDNVTNADISPDHAVITDRLPTATRSKAMNDESQSSIKLTDRDTVALQTRELEEPHPDTTSETFTPPISQASHLFSVSSPVPSHPAAASSIVTQNTYTGRRTSTGAKMPARYRNDLLKEFLEPLLWAFGCRYETRRIQSHLSVRNLRIPVDLSGVVYSAPKERPSSIVGSLVGPLIAVQGRHGTTFGKDDAQSDSVDLLAEVGAMLLIAQERAREGTVEISPNLNKWFVTKPRWGGGTGEAIGEPLGPVCEEEIVIHQEQSNDLSMQSEEPPTKKRSQDKRVRAAKARETAKKENLRKSTMPPGPRWDSRVKYMRLGKDAENDFDNVCYNGNKGPLRFAC